MFLFLILFTTHIPAYGSSTVVKITPHVLTVTVNEQSSGSLELISVSIGQAWFGWFFQGVHFIPSEANDLSKRKLHAEQALVNQMNIT